MNTTWKTNVSKGSKCGLKPKPHILEWTFIVDVFLYVGLIYIIMYPMSCNRMYHSKESNIIAMISKDAKAFSVKFD